MKISLVLNGIDAIGNATGTWIDRIPFTPERVWQALAAE